MRIAGTLTAALIVGACLVTPGGSASALPAPTGVVTAPTAGTAADLLPTTVSLNAPPSATVPSGSRFVLRGNVSGGTGRALDLELDTAAGWLRLGGVDTDATGAYALELPTDWLYRGQLRLSAPATGSDAVGESALFGTGVVPTYTPRGSATDWGLSVPGVRWDPCGGPLSYRVNLAGAPARRLTQLRQALRLVHQATGLDFAYAGTTTAVPYRTDGRTATRSDADLTIAFASARQVRQFRTRVVGLGGFAWSGYAITQGMVTLDRGARLQDSFGTGQTWGTLMLHEIGHAMGLAHASGQEQVMHSGINSHSRGSYQAGDLTGLRREGAGGGCVPPWRARGGVPQVVVTP